jgi:hypothetical protein
VHNPVATVVGFVVDMDRVMLIFTVLLGVFNAVMLVVDGIWKFFGHGGEVGGCGSGRMDV